MKKFIVLAVLGALLIPSFVSAQPFAPKPGEPGYGTQIPTYGSTNGSVVTTSGRSTTSTNPTPNGCANLANSGIAGVVGCILTLFNYAIVIMIAAAVVFVIYGALQMMMSEEKRASGRQTVYYGIIGLFVMVSVWGFVTILDKTFDLRSNPIPPPRLN